MIGLLAAAHEFGPGTSMLASSGSFLRWVLPRQFVDTYFAEECNILNDSRVRCGVPTSLLFRHGRAAQRCCSSPALFQLSRTNSGQSTWREIHDGLLTLRDDQILIIWPMKDPGFTPDLLEEYWINGALAQRP
jgi:hypothetical protein